MSAEDRIDRRWSERAGAYPPTADDRIGALLRQVVDPGPLPAAHLERVGARLASTTAGAKARWHRSGNPGLRWAVAAALVLGTGGVVFARREIAHMLTVVAAHLADDDAPPSSAKRGVRAGSAPTVEDRPAVSTAPTGPPTDGVSAGDRASESLPLPQDSPPPRRARAPRLASANSGRVNAREDRPIGTPAPAQPSERLPSPPLQARPSVAIAPAPMPSLIVPSPGVMPAGPAPSAVAPAPGLGEEARLVRRALEELRHDREPAAALASLDEHRARFPRGVLRADAEIVRIEALLALDRDGEALVLLERLDLGVSPRGDELQVIRGELRATRDCRVAIGDFDRALDRPISEALAERALRARAACRLRLGERKGAEDDLRAYLERFPRGKFAGEARRRLEP